MASDSHGGTAAAWTAVAIIVTGCLVSAVALPLSSTVLFFVGLAVIVLGVVAGKVMSMMGMGEAIAYKDEHDPDYDHPDEDESSPDERLDEQQSEPGTTS